MKIDFMRGVSGLAPASLPGRIRFVEIDGLSRNDRLRFQHRLA